MGVMDHLSLSRASRASYIDAGGVLRMAEAGQARLDHHPVTRAARGILLEGAGTNTLRYASDYTNAVWIKGAVATQAGAVASPDGAMAGSLLRESATNDFHQLTQVASLAASQTHALSVYARAGPGNRRLRIAGRTAGSWSTFPQGIFDLAAGTVVSGAGVSPPTIEPAGNGWYRCTVTGQTAASGSTNSGMILQLTTPAGSGAHEGDDVSGVHPWGAQLEQASFATSHVPTTTAAAARAADLLTLPLGSWFNPAEGTFLVEATPRSAVGSNPLLSIASANNANTVNIARSGDGLGFYASRDGVSQLNAWNGSASPANVPLRAALAYRDGSYGWAFQVAGGSLREGEGAGLLPNFASVGPDLMIGHRNPGNGGQVQAMRVHDVTYWPKRLAKAELREIARLAA